MRVDVGVGVDVATPTAVPVREAEVVGLTAETWVEVAVGVGVRVGGSVPLLVKTVMCPTV